MTTHTKTASTRGRKPASASTTPAKSKSTAEKVSYNTDIPIRRKVKEERNVEYEISKGGGIVYLIPQKGVTIYDKDLDTVREIRYCPNEPSIYVDEQSDNAVKEAIVFRSGKLFVPKEKPNLRAFLDKHPSNIANGGHVFKVIDVTKDAEVELEKEFSVIEAVSMVREKDINDLLPVAIYYGMNINRPVSEIKFDLLKEAKKNPATFVQSFDSPSVKTRSLLHQASEYQVLLFKRESVRWFDSNREILSVPVGEDPLDVITRFCMTEKGASTLESVREKMKNILS